MRRWLSLLWTCVVCIPMSAGGGQTWATGQTHTEDISEVAAHAAMIFRGRVVAVVPEPSRVPDEVAAMRVTIAVEDAVRGVTPGQMVTIRQWNHDVDEYRIGESLVLFLYAPSDTLGLTSPVAGRAGHRRPDEVPTQVLDSLREPAVREAPAPITPRALPRRPPKKLPRRMAPEREVAQ